MRFEEYFGGWVRVIDMKELNNVIGQLNLIKRDLLCPIYSDIFKAFNLCPYTNLKVVMIGQDPYPQKGVATGILFGNKDDTKLSPSLEVIQEACINFEIPHNSISFDPTLEGWVRQGILMVNSALTCEVNKVGSHTMMWRPFMTKLLRNLSERETGIIYVLFGEQAKTLRPYINKNTNIILEEKHPAYYARQGERMPSTIFQEVSKLAKEKYGEPIIWFHEY